MQEGPTAHINARVVNQALQASNNVALGPAFCTAASTHRTSIHPLNSRSQAHRDANTLTFRPRWPTALATDSAAAVTDASSCMEKVVKWCMMDGTAQHQMRSDPTSDPIQPCSGRLRGSQ